jgi:hypothetical protein
MDGETIKDWGQTWLSGSKEFEDYVENYLRYLFYRRYEGKATMEFHAGKKDSGRLCVFVDTHFDIRDSRGEPIDSWIILEFKFEFPRPYASICLKGDYFCYENPETWDPSENRHEVFHLLREAISKQKALFSLKGESAKPKSLIATYKEKGMRLEGKYSWSVLFPRKVFELTDALLESLGYEAIDLP